MNGEILFIIAPSNEDFFEITYQSLTKNSNLNFLSTYGFYFLLKKNKKEWFVNKNKYLNILHVCKKFKNFYNYAIVLSGNIFVDHTKLMNIFDKIIFALHNLRNNYNYIFSGFPYLNYFKYKNEDIRDNLLLQNNLEYYYLKNIFKENLYKMIDYDFFIVNLERFDNFIHMNNLEELFVRDYQNNHVALNLLFLNNTFVLQNEGLYLKENIKTITLKNIVNKNNSIYKFTENFFPLPKLKYNKETNLINYYIFNRLFDLYQSLDTTKLNDSLASYIEEQYIKTKFADICKLNMN